MAAGCSLVAHAGVIVAILLLVTNCQAICLLSDDPSMKSVLDFIKCAKKQLLSSDQAVNEDALRSPNTPEALGPDFVDKADLKRDFSNDFDRFLFSLRFDEMEDFPYCDGLHPEQCITLLKFLEHLLQARVLETMDETADAVVAEDGPGRRVRRSYPGDPLQELLKLSKPVKMHPDSRKALQQSMDWALKMGRGSTQSRWGRSLPAAFLGKSRHFMMTPYAYTRQGLANNKPATGSTARFYKSDVTSYERRGGSNDVSPFRKRGAPTDIRNLKLSPELEGMLSKFSNWRVKHGYGKAVGRWG